jgi:quercetin dioxygenase-like cupin family protein
MQTTASRTYQLARDAGRAAVWWLGGQLAVKADGEDTAGAFSQLEVNDPRGTAPPVHIHHREDETFYVVAGEVTIFVGEERFEASAGDYVFMPRGVPHTYLVRSDWARCFVTFAPAGFERFFVETGVPIIQEEPEPAPVVPDPETFARRLAPYGIEIVAPPPMHEPAPF